MTLNMSHLMDMTHIACSPCVSTATCQLQNAGPLDNASLGPDQSCRLQTTPSRK
jgi:hypothetical protein